MSPRSLISPFRSLPAVIALGGLAAALGEPPSELPENWLSHHLPPGVEVRADLPYVTGGHERQRLDLYLPASGDAPRPLVVFVHGGGWLMGSKSDSPKALGKLLERGYVVASVGYRLSQHARFPAQIEDVEAAVRWLRAHADEYHLDPAHVGAVGPSAGGHLVALLGATGRMREFDVGEHLDQSSEVQAVVDYYGPTDFSQMQAHMLPNAPVRHDTPDSAEARLIGGAVEDPANRVAVERSSPLHWLGADAPPFLIFHGDRDDVVPYQQSELLYAALVKLHVPVRFVTVHGAAHGWLFPTDQLGDMVADFFEHYLRGVDNGVGRTLASRDEVPAAKP